MEKVVHCVTFSNAAFRILLQYTLSTSAVINGKPFT